MKPVPYIADHIRRVLQDGGSAPHTAEVQWFFKEEIKSRGWYTAELRKVAKRFHRSLLADCGRDYLVKVADDLFHGDVLEEKVMAVFLLQPIAGELGDREFRLLERWLPRVSTWADHDGLASYLLGPMIVAKPARVERVFAWAKAKNRWARRAAAVSLIRGARVQMLFPEIERVTEMLLSDTDDMVRKGLGWLLREHAKFNRDAAMPLLLSIKDRAARRVLRTACEKLGPQDRAKVLA